jgi:peptidoglycan-associated lipoprotein
MNKIQVFCCLLVLSLVACQKQQKQEYAGVDGDNVTGTPLPPRQEGVSFFSNNVTKGQFKPIYFAYDSFQIAADEGEKLRQIGSFMKTSQNKIILAGFTDERGTPEYTRAQRTLVRRRLRGSRDRIRDTGISGSSFPSWPGLPARLRQSAPLYGRPAGVQIQDGGLERLTIG